MSKTTNTQDNESQYGLFQLTEVPNTYRKAVQIVHSKPRVPMSLLQRKIANAWLKNACETAVDDDGWWKIGIAGMSEDIAFSSHNREYLRETALELMRIVFEWDVIAPENKRIMWKASVLFPEVELHADYIKYQISSQLRDKVLHPEMYALIDLNIIKRFRRGATLAMYEYCIRFVNIGRTAEVKWETFRDMILGVDTETKPYQEYKYFKQKVLKLCQIEITSESDIKIELVEIKNGTKVAGIYFLISKVIKETNSEPTDVEVLAAIGGMVNIGIPQSEAKRIGKTYAINEIDAALKYTLTRNNDNKAGKLENPAAYFRQALKNKWGTIEDTKVKVSSGVKQGPIIEGTLQDAYAREELKNAESYFNELDLTEQNINIKRYNEQQPIESLKIKQNKMTKAAQSSFFRWLALDTWGTPTNDRLLEFAQIMLTRHNVTS